MESWPGRRGIGGVCPGAGYRQLTFQSPPCPLQPRGGVTHVGFPNPAAEPIAVLDLTSAAESLADEVLRSGLLPVNADGDAAHIALASTHSMDIVLTWNCRHIANAAIVGRLRRLVETQGHKLPEIYTPEEFLGE